MNGQSNKFGRVYRSQQGHQRISSAVMATRDRQLVQTPQPIVYPMRPPTDSPRSKPEKHEQFRHQQEIHQWQSRYSFLLKNYETQKERLAEITASHDRLKKQLTQSIRETKKHQFESNPNINRTSVEIYERETQKGELISLRRDNMHLQQSVSGCRRQLKDCRARNDQLMEVIHSQEELIGKLKQNLMIAVQSNREQVQLLPYNVRIPKYDTMDIKLKDAD